MGFSPAKSRYPEALASGLMGQRKDPGFSPRGLPLPPHLRNLAYAPQTAAIFPHLTVGQNVAFPLAVRNLSPQIDDLLTLFDLDRLAERLPSNLSGGELQRVNLARALAVPNPTLLVLDEPFTGIDRSTRNLLIPKLAALPTPILSVTHDIEEVFLIHAATAAEVIRIDSGRILAQGPATVVLAPERSQLLETLGTPTL
jgi:ABC-type molybdate transport system ATPase subunit